MKGDDMVDYSLNTFKEWLMNQKNPRCGKSAIWFTESMLKQFEESLKTQPRYDVREEPTYYAVYDTKTNTYIVTFNKDVDFTRNLEEEAQKYAEYLNKKEDGKPEISIDTTSFSEKIKKNNEIMQKNMKILGQMLMSSPPRHGRNNILNTVLYNIQFKNEVKKIVYEVLKEQNNR